MNKKELIKILLVDDDDTLLINLETLLTLSGYEIIKAANGKEGLSKAKIDTPGIIISDIRMPFMDGQEFLLELKKNNKTKNIPFIFLTGINDVNEMEKSIANGADIYLTKPYKSKLILSSIHELIDEKNTYQN